MGSFVRSSAVCWAERSERHPIKKWAALAALGAATFYLLLSGAEVATQRSFIMVAIVLIGVMVDRPTLTLRTLTVAALAVLLLAPESIVHPSFQMSFRWRQSFRRWDIRPTSTNQPPAATVAFVLYPKGSALSQSSIFGIIKSAINPPRISSPLPP